MSLQHVFAMFGATILVPLTTGLPVSVALFTSGVGTLIYILCTKAKVPVYLGSSFAYITPIAIISGFNDNVAKPHYGSALTGLFVVGIISVSYTHLYACFPIPSEVVLPAAGAIAAATDKSFAFVLLLCTAAGFFGTFFCYGAGYFGGPRFVRYLGGRFPRASARIEESFAYYRRHGDLAVALGRVIPLCRTYIAFVAGASRQKAARYAGFSLIGITLWNAALIGLGYLFADNVAAVGKFVSAYKTVIVYIAILG